MRSALHRARRTYSGAPLLPRPQRRHAAFAEGPARALTASQLPPNPRRSRFDLPSERRYKLPEPPYPTEAADEEPQRTIRLDEISPADVLTQWPPEALVAPSPKAEPVKRPDLWLRDETSVGPEDVGRFVKLAREDLIENLPEGPCGEFVRDLALIPSRKRAVGFMLRKLTVEMIMQLSELQNAKNAHGVPRIRKAGFLVDGHRGTGKSQVLNLLAVWARRNGWLVVLEPKPSRYSREIAEIRRSNTGVYIQNEFAQQFLEATSIANRKKFEDIPVDLSVYGGRAIDGGSVQETCRLYEPLIEKTVDQEVAERGLSGVERLRMIAAYKKKVRVPSMVDQLQEPGSVWDIVEFGLQNQAYATQAVAEMFVQLQKQTTHPVLVIVDEWNECFPVSEYVSIRYDNTRFHGYIPAYHLTMPRVLHSWDGALYRRGLKICATSWLRYKRRDYKPELLGVKDYEIRTVRNFSQSEFANYVTYLRMMNVLHNFPREDLEYFYMLTQGNGWEARRLLATLY